MAVLVAFAVESQAQATPRVSVDNDVCTSSGIPSEFLQRLLEREFVGLVGSSPTVPGTFGALEIDKDQKATLSASSRPGDGRVLTVTASGGASDGLLVFLNDREAASSFSVGARLDWRSSPPTNRLQYDVATCRAYLAAWRKAMADGEERVSRIAAGTLPLTKELDVRREEYRLDSLLILKDILLPARIRARVDSLATAADDATRRQLILRLRADSLKQDTLPLDIATTRARKEQAERRFVPDEATQRSESDDKRALELQAAEQLLKVLGFSLGWASAGVGLDNAAFKLFDPAAAFESQLTSKTYATPKLALAYSRYTLDAASERSRFWSAGLRLSISDNRSSLRKVELSETAQHGPAEGDRSSTSKISALQGEYKKDLATMQMSFDYYRFVANDNQGAWHLFPAVEYRKHARPTYTAGVGFLWVARKAGEGFLNAELMYSLNDIAEAESSPDNVWERSRVGIRLSFPITFSPR